MAAAAQKYLFVIGGSTASGKTALAIRLALGFSTEIISADSRQFYKELMIGVARPSEHELQSVPHHFIADRSVFNPVNAGSYAAEARLLIDDLFREHQVLVVAGGTGLYIKALLEGFDPLPPADQALRDELNTLYREEGIEALRARFLSQGNQPANIEPDNPQRLIRAIEIQENRENEPQHAIPGFRTSFHTVKWYIRHERDALYSRIDHRVDEMLASGLEDEARMLLPHRNLVPLRTVGYTELFDYFDGAISRDEAIAKIKQHTRNYAKRQLTWFRKDPGFIPLEPDPGDEAIRNLLPTPLSSSFQKSD